ncbi:MAG: hypothetical protein KF830_18680 [Planctomycetes bacterium]|nr:hypothetical protein [Planctomycetota bacterium]
MHRFLFSSAPATTSLASVAACWRAIGDDTEPRELLRRPGVALFAAHAADEELHQDARGFCYLPAPPPHSLAGARLAAAAVLDGVRRRGPAALTDLLPPHAVVVQAEPEGPILVATDAHGLQHVYGHVGADRVLVSGSCLLLAGLAAADLDAEAVTTFLRLGHYLGDDSPFVGVDKLAGGTAWQVVGPGRTRLVLPAAPVAPPADAAACLRACVRTQLEAAPEALVELSGGLDSRLIVAALGPDACRGRRAMTLGTADAADVRIAARLARDLGFDWQFVDLAQLAELPAAEVLTLVRRASRRCDHAAQPLARAVLEWVNGQVPPQPRFSGQNGELARGFFHPTFPDHPEVTGPLVDRLLDWRLSANDCIARELVDADHWQQHDARLRRRLFATLRGYGRPWLAATDEFYLRERMQRWVGAAYSAETQDHAIMAPFFDPRFVAWARQLAARDKRDSRAMAQLIGELWPALADVPVAGGLSPRLQGSSSVWARGRRRLQFAQKVVRKLHQRLRGTRRAPVGSPDLARRLCAGGAVDAAAFPRTAALPWIRSQAIGPVLARGVENWASLGQLLALEWTLEALDAARRAPR